jgi:DNA-binding MarR family transcriptional regulator
MAETVSQEVIRKLRKLAQLPQETRQSRFAVSITRLTVLKSLCQQPNAANRFVTYLAQRTRQKVEEKAKRPGYLSMEEWARHREMIDRAVAALEHSLGRPSEEGRSRLWTLFQELAGEQNEHRTVHGGPVRIIKDNDLLLVEYALSTVLAGEAGAPLWAYQTARCYAERYEASYGNGLTPASAPMVQDIADFWLQELGLTLERIATPARARKPKEEKSPATPGKQKVRFTHRQGQFLAFIYLYRKLHRRGPAELDMVQFFRVTPPSVHGMVVKLEQLGMVAREPGISRSIRVTIPASDIPALEEAQGPSW